MGRSWRLKAVILPQNPPEFRRTEGKTEQDRIKNRNPDRHFEGAVKASFYGPLLLSVASSGHIVEPIRQIGVNVGKIIIFDIGNLAEPFGIVIEKCPVAKREDF